jgi:hypothetical protein
MTGKFAHFVGLRDKKLIVMAAHTFYTLTKAVA